MAVRCSTVQCRVWRSTICSNPASYGYFGYRMHFPYSTLMPPRSLRSDLRSLTFPAESSADEYYYKVVAGSVASALPVVKIQNGPCIVTTPDPPIKLLTFRAKPLPRLLDHGWGALSCLAPELAVKSKFRFPGFGILWGAEPEEKHIVVCSDLESTSRNFVSRIG